MMAVWGAQPGAAMEDVSATWAQLIALHRKANSLLRERTEADVAFRQDPSEANFAWIKDVNARLAAVGGTEALIEGFGEMSGRAKKSM